MTTLGGEVALKAKLLSKNRSGPFEKKYVHSFFFDFATDYA